VLLVLLGDGIRETGRGGGLLQLTLRCACDDQSDEDEATARFKSRSRQVAGLHAQGGSACSASARGHQGPRPVRDTLLDAACRETARQRARGQVRVHGDAFVRIVRRNRACKARGRRSSESPARALVQWCDDTSILFRDTDFEIMKLQKVSTHLKISKNKICREAIDLQLSQRVSYVLINGLSGNVGRSWQNSRPQVTVHSTFNSIFDQFALKIGMSANYENCVLGNNEQLLYWPILNFYSEIWRTRKKTKSAFKEI
jgi:hypothetical protein